MADIICFEGRLSRILRQFMMFVCNIGGVICTPPFTHSLLFNCLPFNNAMC